MKQILDYIDFLIEAEKIRDQEYKIFCHSVHKDMKAIGESPMINYLKNLKELVEITEEELKKGVH